MEQIIKNLELKITELENKLKSLTEPEINIDPEEFKTFQKVFNIVRTSPLACDPGPMYAAYKGYKWPKINECNRYVQEYKIPKPIVHECNRYIPIITCYECYPCWPGPEFQFEQAILAQQVQELGAKVEALSGKSVAE